MSTTGRRFSKEFKGKLCCEVIETSKPIRDLAEAYRVGSESLRRSLIKCRQKHGTEPGLLHAFLDSELAEFPYAARAGCW